MPESPVFYSLTSPVFSFTIFSFAALIGAGTFGYAVWSYTNQTASPAGNNSRIPTSLIGLFSGLSYSHFLS